MDVLFFTVKKKKISEKQIPLINRKAYFQRELINARDLTAKPPHIKHFSTDELHSFIDSSIKPDVADLLSHSKNVERNLKLLAEASGDCHGFESRRRIILAEINSQKMHLHFLSNGLYSQTYDAVTL